MALVAWPWLDPVLVLVLVLDPVLVAGLRAAEAHIRHSRRCSCARRVVSTSEFRFHNSSGGRGFSPAPVALTALRLICGHRKVGSSVRSLLPPGFKAAP